VDKAACSARHHQLMKDDQMNETGTTYGEKGNCIKSFGWEAKDRENFEEGLKWIRPTQSKGPVTGPCEYGILCLKYF
jgi:hypothetical protein